MSATTNSGSDAMGEAISSSEMVTVQFAVPPRTSAPYDGRKVTNRSSSMAAFASIWPMEITPCPPNPEKIVLISIVPLLLPPAEIPLP